MSEKHPKPASSDAAILPTLVDSGHATTSGSSHPQRVDTADRPVEESGFGARYETRSVLGRGGMGEVRLCRDSRIGREVALKVVREGTGSAADVKSRFLREARVQGQLEHPAVVPVYDIGVGPGGAEYFTMRRVRGSSLEEIFERVRQGHAETRADFSMRRVLSAFLQVCLAVDFAHRRGVIHRDLKPANIMLGDFGEVYLLDWGLARVTEKTGTDSVDAKTERTTMQGSILGTPGFMAPEQVGSSDEIDGRADVYALGSILFEALTLEPLHPRGPAVTTHQIIASTLRGADARAQARAPDREIPPELESACVRATALDPSDRFRSARELADAIESYLDGDRDLELRRKLGASHAEGALRQAERAFGGDEPARTTALREVGRALALDPQNVGALRTLARLLSEPPRTIPPEVEAEATAADRSHHRIAARGGGFAFFSFALYVPFYLWLGIRNWTLAVLVFGLLFAAGGASIATSLAQDRHVMKMRWVALFLALSGIACTAGMFGPFMILPALTAVVTMSFCMIPDRKGRVWTIVAGAVAIAIPAVVEWAGWLPASYLFEGGRMIVVPRTNEMPRTATFATLLAVSLASVVTPSIFLGKVRDALSDAERSVLLQKWQLSRLVPE